MIVSWNRRIHIYTEIVSLGPSVFLLSAFKALKLQQARFPHKPGQDLHLEPLLGVFFEKKVTWVVTEEKAFSLVILCFMPSPGSHSGHQNCYCFRNRLRVEPSQKLNGLNFQFNLAKMTPKIGSGRNICAKLGKSLLLVMRPWL